MLPRAMGGEDQRDLRESREGVIFMKILIAALFYCLYWGVCFLCTGTDKKNLAGLKQRLLAVLGG